ncbi:hypothetical protein AX27061_4934 [Achromobacter xylosoxidans NBRC 15126 = ATCC 27061]|nr:hypothetical protein AX27061_4934 [Achromobacter xylosoxidans NBRC 15126 = ATCC 27061]
MMSFSPTLRNSFSTEVKFPPDTRKGAVLALLLTHTQGTGGKGAS